MTPPYDTLIRGGTLVDPAQGTHARRDIAISGDRIARVAEEIHEEEAGTVIDATGRIVTPGFVDLHVHVWWGVAHLGIPADPNCLAKGVTTAFDAGSAGADTFPGFRKYVIDVSATRIRAFLHVSSQGQLCRDIGELSDLRYADVKRAVAMCEAHRDVIVGVKIRMSRSIVGENGTEGLKRARAVCEATGLPLMLHPNDSPLPFEKMLAEMRPGDILTHCYHQSDTGILGPGGRVRPEARRAAEGGILFDVGHGAGSFSFDVAEKAAADRVLPGTISSDLHFYNVDGPVYSLAHTVSKFLHLGLPLDVAVEKVTSAPAKAMGLLGEIGTAREGACADLSLFDLRTGTFTFTDTRGQTRTGERLLEPVSTFRGGELFAPSAFDFA